MVEAEDPSPVPRRRGALRDAQEAASHTGPAHHHAQPVSTGLARHRDATYLVATHLTPQFDTGEASARTVSAQTTDLEGPPPAGRAPVARVGTRALPMLPELEDDTGGDSPGQHVVD